PTALVITGWLSETRLPMITLSPMHSAAAIIASNASSGSTTSSGPEVIQAIPAKASTAPSTARGRSRSSPSAAASSTATSGTTASTTVATPAVTRTSAQYNRAYVKPTPQVP